MKLRIFTVAELENKLSQLKKQIVCDDIADVIYQSDKAKYLLNFNNDEFNSFVQLLIVNRALISQDLLSQKHRNDAKYIEKLKSHLCLLTQEAKDAFDHEVKLRVFNNDELQRKYTALKRTRMFYDLADVIYYKDNVKAQFSFNDEDYSLFVNALIYQATKDDAKENCIVSKDSLLTQTHRVDVKYIEKLNNIIRDTSFDFSTKQTFSRAIEEKKQPENKNVEVKNNKAACNNNDDTTINQRFFSHVPNDSQFLQIKTYLLELKRVIEKSQWKTKFSGGIVINGLNYNQKTKKYDPVPDLVAQIYKGIQEALYYQNKEKILEQFTQFADCALSKSKGFNFFGKRDDFTVEFYRVFNECFNGFKQDLTCNHINNSIQQPTRQKL